jgi:hypothetical protein
MVVTVPPARQGISGAFPAPSGRPVILGHMRPGWSSIYLPFASRKVVVVIKIGSIFGIEPILLLENGYDNLWIAFLI